METREKIVGAVFLIMFFFGLGSLGFQLVLDRLSGVQASAVTYGVFGSMVATGATGYAGLFYFLFRFQQSRELMEEEDSVTPAEEEAG